MNVKLPTQCWGLKQNSYARELSEFGILKILRSICMRDYELTVLISE
jgi:hypothetical protein